MSIVKNIFNPVPLHESTSEWYDNRKTFKGECSHIYLPKGELPTLQITGDTSWRPQYNTIDVSGISVASAYSKYNGQYTAAYDYSRSTAEIVFVKSGYINISFVVNRLENGLYSAHFADSTTGERRDMAYVTLAGALFEFNGDLLTRMVGFSLFSSRATAISAISFTGSVWSASMSQYFKLCDMQGSVMYADTMNVQVDAVPQHVFTEQRAYTVMIGGSVGFDTAGRYYMTFEAPDGKTYYTEPFDWVSDNRISQMVKIEYRRSLPLLTSKDYIPFTRQGRAISFVMYVDSCVMMPPSYFTEDMEENDGVKSVRKRVSYRNHKFSDHKATEYMAEAYRLLWHCNEVSINDTEVDYIDAPEPDWGNDNHFCSVTIEYQTDTIVESNGEAVNVDNYGTHMALADTEPETFER